MPTPSLLQILQHTPTWVFILLAGLGWLGVKQMLPNRVALARALLMPLAMGAFSLYGMLSTFGGLSVALAVWGLCAAAALAMMLRRPVQAGVAYDPVRQQFDMPGSAMPLLLTLAIFCAKYAVGISLALHPELARNMLAAPLLGMVYGVFSGIFLGRAARLLRLALRAGGRGNGGSDARFA